MKNNKIIDIIINTKAIFIVGVVEIIAMAALHIAGNSTAKWHLLAWMAWIISIVVCRIYINGSVRRKVISEQT